MPESNVTIQSCPCCGYADGATGNPVTRSNGECARCNYPIVESESHNQVVCLAQHWRCAACGRHFDSPDSEEIRTCSSCMTAHSIRSMNRIRYDYRIARYWIPYPPRNERILCEGCDGCDECCSDECAGCAYCMESRQQSSGLYFKRPLTFHSADKYKEHKYNPLSRHISVEIEVASIEDPGALISVVRKWNGSIVHDGSINPDNSETGFEINTAPASGDRFVKQIEEIDSALRAGRAELNRNCGLHVHVDSRDLSWDEIANVCETYLAVEPFLFGLVPPGRKSNKYCKPIGSQLMYALGEYRRSVNGQHQIREGLPNRWKQEFLMRMYGGMENARVQKHEKYVPPRYWALNIHTWRMRKTLEFRHHHGTLQSNKIINWAMLCANIVDKGSGIWRPDLRGPDQNVAMAKQFAVSAKHLAWIASRWNRFNPEKQLTRSLLPSDSMEI